MGLTKQYLRYAAVGNFNIIASVNCNIVFVVIDNEGGRYLAAGAAEDIVVWDLRLSEKRLVIPGEKHEVVQLAASPNKVLLAAGYSDGTIKTYDLKTTDNINTFSGHRTGISCFAFDHHGHRLASGAKDTDIVVWDLVAETGLIRLSGHKGVVTQVQFFTDRDILISSSKDTFIKLWDIATGHCFKTIAGHVTEVWGLGLVRENDFLVAGSADSELRVWQITDVEEDKTANNKDTHTLIGEDDCISRLSSVACIKAGSILRNGKGRVLSLRTDPNNTIIAVHSNDYNVELFQFLSKEEANSKLKKRLRKERKKAAKTGEELQETEKESVTLKDTVKRLPVIKCSAKAKSVHLVLGKGSQLRVAVSLANNTIELYGLELSDITKQTEPTKLRSISAEGHHSEVRAVAFSSDNLAIVSGSGDQIKLWNRPSLSSLRTVDTSYVLSVLFVPGDRHVLAGCKDGSLLIIDISIGDILEKIPAHTSELWSICHLPDQTGVVTGGGDNTVKFWQLELVPDTVTNTKAKVLSLLHTRTLQVDESVLCVRVSSNSKFLAVALLDSTVKIFFLDTLKFFLSLYGHKLPVLCMDMSSDCSVIATGSADRCIKIWGLDFGDCHKSIFAHTNSVTALVFVPGTHYFFTTGKDGKVQQWDADNFQKIITLQGHHGEAWGLSVSPNGKYVVSCGQDRVLRLYERTNEPLVLEDEQEAEREAEEENTLATGPDTVTPTNINLASRKTVTAEKAAELLLECLEVGEEYRAAAAESILAGKQPPPPPAIMAAFNVKTADEYLMEIIKRIKASDLEETLLLLPYTSVCQLLPLLKPLLKQALHSDIICRLLVFLLRVHHRPITASPNLQPLITELSELALSSATEMRDLVGVNYHGLMFFQTEMEAKEGVQLFHDATIERKEREKRKRKKTKAIQRAILRV